MLLARLTVLIVVIVALAASLGSASALAMPIEGHAAGGGYTKSGSFYFAFGVTGDPFGANGELSMRACDANASPSVGCSSVRASAECLNVVGNRALLSGLITYSNYPGIVPGYALEYTVEDNGEPGADRDRISAAFRLRPNPLCLAGPVNPAGALVDQGNIDVNP